MNALHAMHDPSCQRPARRGEARWPTSKGVLFFSFVALLASACSSDLFHSTEWETRCAKEPDYAGCPQGGEGGDGGGTAPGSCLTCLDVAGAGTTRPGSTEALCSGSRDAYALLDGCRCADTGACAMDCADTPACGMSGEDLGTCETCMVQKCGAFIEACAASGP